jgi:hypothetical protein
MHDGENEETPMKTANTSALGFICLLQGALAWAEPAGWPESHYTALPKAQSSHRDYANTGQQWVGELEKAGIINRSLHGPYRIALPLATFGESGAALKLTYTRSLPGSGDAGPLLFVIIPLP